MANSENQIGASLLVLTCDEVSAAVSALFIFARKFPSHSAVVSVGRRSLILVLSTRGA